MLRYLNRFIASLLVTLTIFAGTILATLSEEPTLYSSMNLVVSKSSTGLATSFSTDLWRSLMLSSVVTTTSGIYAVNYENSYPRWRIENCRFKRNDEWSTSEVRDTIRCGAVRFSVPGGIDKALSVASCESGFNERASNGGLYIGVYQQAARYWSGRVAVYNRSVSDRWQVGKAIRNARSNVLVSLRMVGASWVDDWPGCGR